MTTQATTYNTPIIDGSIGADWDSDDFMGFAAGETSWRMYLTWDATYLYLAWTGPDWMPSNNDGIYTYIDILSGGTTVGINSENLGHTADFAIEIRQNTASSGYYVYNSGWPGSPTNFAVGDFASINDNAGDTTEVRISWSTLTNGESSTPQPFNITSVNRKNNGTYTAAWPDLNTDYGNANFSFSWNGSGGEGVSPNTLNTNENAPDDGLPVDLTSFTVAYDGTAVQLNWATASEVSNLGFEVYRSNGNGEDPALLDSYRHNEDLQGHGSTTIAHSYSYSDRFIVPGTTYKYQLADVDYNGARTFHAPLEIRVPAAGEEESAGEDGFQLYPNFPNPFNSGTQFRFRLPAGAAEWGTANLVIYNLRGEAVYRKNVRSLPAGNHLLFWDGKRSDGSLLASGVYFYQLQVGNYRKNEETVADRISRAG